MRRRRRGERLLEPPDHRCLYRRGRRSYELAHFLELVHDGLALDTELFREFVNPDLRHYAPSRPSSLDPLPDPGPGRACSGWASAYGHHRRVLIERSSASRPAFRQVFLLRFYSVLPSQVVPPRAMLCRGFRTAKILSQWFEAERSRGAQGPGKRPAPPRKVQARQAGVQVRTPAREPGLRVGLDGVPDCHEAKQAGLLRTLLAAYTGTDDRHTRGVPLGSYGHSGYKSTVSARPRHPARPALPGPPVRGVLPVPPVSPVPSGLPESLPGRPAPRRPT